jgi:hypothetical protein
MGTARRKDRGAAGAGTGGGKAHEAGRGRIDGYSVCQQLSLIVNPHTKPNHKPTSKHTNTHAKPVNLCI